jgi:hypothetical protein
MKKLIFLFLGISIFAFNACDKKSEAAKQEQDAPKAVHEGSKSGYRTYITNVHAPTTASDSILFTADSSNLSLTLFCPLGGINSVAVRDLTSGSILFGDTIGSVDRVVTGFTPGNNYSIKCFYGSGSPANFSRVASSFRNSGQTPAPFTGYTQYFNTISTQGPSDGMVVIIAEEPSMGSKRK